MTLGNRFFLPFGILLLLLSMAVAISFGSVHIPIYDVIRILLGLGNDAVSDSWNLIVWRIRFPRILSAAMVGGFLSVGGVSCQGLFRNPLCEPYLLGISSGAALGATVAIIFGGGIGLFAFVGALTVAITVFLSAGRGAFKRSSTLLLTGIAISFLCQAVIWLLMTLNRDQIERITFWTLGSFSSVSWNQTAFLAAISLPVVLLLIPLGRILDILSTGHDTAYGMGLGPQRSAMIILGLSALGTAASVATAGSIGFVGLMVPHIIRAVGGASHRNLAMRSWFAGAILLVLADLAARTINPPGELPVGIITALLGAPFLFALARKQGNRGI